MIEKRKGARVNPWSIYSMLLHWDLLRISFLYILAFFRYRFLDGFPLQGEVF
jgi:hypothetical protein